MRRTARWSARVRCARIHRSLNTRAQAVRMTRRISRARCRDAYASIIDGAKGESMMPRHAHTVLIALATVATLAAQVPAGWKMRVDRSASAADPDGSGAMTFTTAGAGFHAVNPKASVYWNP